jgi:hypothetical protein
MAAAGLACHRMGAWRADASPPWPPRARSEQGVKVDRIVAVADIGRIINADIARQQIEGGLIYGIGLAIGASMGWRQGLPTAAAGRSGAALAGDCPEVEVELIASEADPFDPGELGVAVAAPAIANALFSATGLRCAACRWRLRNRNDHDCPPHPACRPSRRARCPRGGDAGQSGHAAGATPAAVRTYLAEFLSDRRVVEIPRALWMPILHGIILRTRPAKSAHAYAQVWTRKDRRWPRSPPRRRGLQARLQARMGMR